MISDKPKEIRYIIKEYILPLLCITTDYDQIKVVFDDTKFITQYVQYQDNRIYFKPVQNSTVYAYIENVSDKYLDYDFKLVNRVYSGINLHAKFNYKIDGNSSNIGKIDDGLLIKNYGYYAETAIVSWLFGKEMHKVNSFITQLEMWSTKTYEGKYMSFGFIIDPNSQQGTIDYTEILSEEYTAVISDGFTSLVELDSECKLIRFLSLTENNEIEAVKLKNCLPYRFSGVISKYVTGNKIGIFLLANGDLIISKNEQLQLVKRSGKWLNLDYKAFLISMYPIKKRFSRISNIDILLEEVFSSAIDVSFTHSGGIISIVDTDKLDNDIISINDKLQPSITSDLIKNFYIKKNFMPSEIDKRVRKRDFILSLIGHKAYMNKIPFIDIDRKLRTELLSLDGASIIDENGDILSFGAIIQNDSGSSSGGRSAAAKKLSKYGLAIKISTDGFIEAYVDEKIHHIIK